MDSTVLVAASISGTGAGRDVITLALAGKIDAYISDDVLEETERNLSAKAPTALAAFNAYRERLSSKIVNPSQQSVRDVARSVEPKDAPIVAAAIQARAVYLATYDQKHLLRQRDRIWADFGVMVLSPIEVLYMLPPED